MLRQTTTHPSTTAQRLRWRLHRLLGRAVPLLLRGSPGNRPCRRR
jgi:hypothetical protein